MTSLARLGKLFQSYFYEPDLQALTIVLGAIKAHYLGVGDPAWLFLVGAPGTGKTAMGIMACAGLPTAIVLGDLTENTFLSGFHGHKQPGLLESLGPSVNSGRLHTTHGDAVILSKDFTTVLTMRHEKRSSIIGQLREIHDGSFRRDFGTGQAKAWEGRITIVAAVTPVLDRYYSIFSVLGERFLQVRWSRPRSSRSGIWAIRQMGLEASIRQEAAAEVARLFAATGHTAPALPEASGSRIASLAEFVAVARTHVFREGRYSRQIEYVPEAEANTRISKSVAAIAAGIASLRGHKSVAEDDLQDAMRTALDSIPQARRTILHAARLRSRLDAIELNRVALYREIEEMRELGLVETAMPLTLEGPKVVIPTRKSSGLLDAAIADGL